MRVATWCWTWVLSAAMAGAGRAAEPAGPAETVRFQMAVYLLAEPAKGLGAQVAALQAKDFADLPTAADDDDAPVARPAMRARVVPTADYAPPDVPSLRFSARGVTKEQGARLQASKTAWVIDFVAPAPRAAATVRRAGLLMHRLAADNDALLWDELTREVFSADAWKARRLDGWDGDLPHVARQTTIHFYAPADGVLPRAITLGMAKFGRPDVVVEQVPRGATRAVGTLISAACQALVERPSPPEQLPAAGKPGALALDVRALKHPAMKQVVGTFLDGATGKLTLGLRDGKRQDGDPDNRLLEIRFDGYPGDTDVERQSAALAQAFGSRDEVRRFKGGDDELKAASGRARQALPAKKAAFAKGLPPGDHLLVKAPFKTSGGGNEWMWVEIVRWDGDRIRGILQNEPADVPELKSGADVAVAEADVMDYQHYREDGTSEGNETGKVIERRAKERPATAAPADTD